MKNNSLTNNNGNARRTPFLKFALLAVTILLSVIHANAATFFSQATNNFSVLSNWNTASNGSGTAAIASNLTSGLDNFIIKDGHTITIDVVNLNILDLTVGQGVSGGLYVGDATTRTSTINGVTTINAGGSMLTGVAINIAHTLTFRGNIVNNGVLDLYADISTNTASTLNRTTITVSGSGSFEFYHFTLAGTTTVNLTQSTTIGGNVNIPANCTINDGNLTHNVAGDWTEAGNGQLTGNGTINFIAGTGAFIIPVQSITAAATFNNLTINGNAENVILNGGIIVNGSLFVNGNSSFLTASNVNHTVAKDFAVSVGSTYNQTAGSLTFNGATIQAIDFTFVTVNTLTFSNGGISNPKNLTGDIVAAGAVTISNTAAVNSSGNHNFNAGFRQDGICNFIGSITFNGGTVNSSLLTTDFGSANIICGAGTTTFQQFVGANPITFNINNDFTVNTGATAQFGNCANAATTINGQGSFNFNVNGTGGLIIRGANGFPQNFNSYNFSPTSTTTYNCDFTQTVRGGISYGNLTLNNTVLNTKTTDGILDINGNLTVSGFTNANLIGFDITIASNHTVTTGGTFTNDATVTYDNLDGNQTIGPAAGGTINYENITFILDNATNNRTKSINNNINVGGNFIEINNGGTSTLGLIVNMGTSTITNDGDGQFILGDYTQINVTGLNNFLPAMTSFGSKSLSILSTVLYNNTTQNTVQILASGFTYGNLQLNGSGVGINYKSASGSLDINGNFTRIGNNAVFRDSGYSHTIGGNYNLRDVDYIPSGCGVTITFDGDFQNIGAGFNNMTFPNLVFTGTGTKTMTSQNNLTNVVQCNLTVDNNVIVDFNNKNLNISGNFINGGIGGFIQTGTTRFISATLNQTVSMTPGSYFGNLTINKPTVGLKTLTPLTDIDINGSLTLTANAADFDCTNKVIYVGGNATWAAGTTFTSSGGTFNFDGAGAQSLNLSLNPVTFNCVNFTGSGTKTITAGSMLTTCDINISALSIFNASNFNITTTGNWVNNGTFQQGCGNTVTFNAAGPQTISGSQFGGVVFAGSGVKTLAGGISPCGILTINVGVTLETTISNYPISVGGTWTNNGTFNVNNSLVSFIGNSKTINTGGNAVGKRFYDVLVAQNLGQTATLGGNIAILNDFTITTGNVNTGAFTVDAYGNWVVNDVFNSNNNAGLVTLRAASGSKTFKPGSALTCFYRGITVNTGGTYTITSDDLVLTNSQPLTLTAGTFKLGGRLVQLTGATGVITIAAGSELYVDEDANLQMSNNSTITNNGGTLRIVGIAGHYATIQRNASGNFTITQNSGVLYAKNYSIQNTQTNGLTVAGGTIDATDNLSDGIFSNGIGTSYLNLNGINFADFTANNVQFNVNGIVPTFNVARTSGTGNITFNGSTGTLAGAAFENDNLNAATGRVRWTTSAKKWTNAIGNNDWHTPGNWNPAIVPSSADTVYIDHNTIAAATPIVVNITSADAFAGRLVLDRNSFSGTGSVTLNVGTTRTLTVSENVNILVGTVLTQANNTAILNCGGSFLNVGTFNNGNSTVNLNGPIGIYPLSLGGSSFYNLNVNSLGQIQLGAATTVTNNLNITNGLLDVTTTNFALNVGGNWSLTAPGLFAAQQGTVTFNNAGNQTISNNGTFYNFVTAGSGTKQVISATLGVTNDITIAASTVLDAGTNTINIGRHWINNAVAGFTQTGAGTVVFQATTGNQNIDAGSQTTTFNNITTQGAGTKTVLRPINVNGDFNIIAGSGAVDFGIQQVTGTASKMFSVQGATAIVRGTNNFPTAFGTVTLATNSTVQYLADINQSVFATNYGNLTLGRVTAVNTTKTLLGTTTIAGNLTINDVNTQLNATNQQVFLTGNMAFPTGGLVILWGTTGTLTHNGGNWTIDVDYTGFATAFNNLILSGSGAFTKTLGANLNISGNVNVQNSISLTMGAFTMTGTGPKSLTLDAGGIINCAIPSSTGAAFPLGFGVYNLDCSSTVNLVGGAINQTIFTDCTYGNLILSNTVGNNATMTGSLNLCGNFNTRNATLIDGGFNITSTGATVDIRFYTPTLTSTLALAGGNQNVIDGQGGGANLDIPNLLCTNAGIKTIAAGQNNIINLLSNVNVNTGVTLSITNRTVNFSGVNWQNNGTFGHYNVTNNNNYFYYTGNVNQTVDMGLLNSYEHYVHFNKTGGSVTFVNNGGIFTRTSGTPLAFYVLTGNTVNMGTLTHEIRGTVQNDGTWTTNNANFLFSGGNQTFVTPTFVAKNVTTSNTGTKTMGCDWQVNDLTIGANTTLNTTNVGNFNITLTGNWINNGAFTVNTGNVTFESNNTTAKVIQGGNSNFRNVLFNQSQTNARTYTLTSATTTFTRDLTIGNGATLDVNGNSLTLGSNNTGYIETHTVAAGGTLKVSSNATLRVNNDNGNSTINVAGTLITIGNNLLPARITRSTANNRININITGTLSAQYYAYEYLSDNGMILQPGSNVDVTNNLSNGTWSFINTAAGAPKYYLQLNCNVIANPITGVAFNFAGVATVGTHFNVRRTVAPAITFGEVLSGSIGSFLYESDDNSATTGNLLWPVPNTVTWTGALNSDWNVAGNWLPMNVPTLSDNAIIPDVTNDPIIFTANAICKNLTLTTGNLKLNGFDLTVYNDVFLGTGLSSAYIIVLSNSSDINVYGSWTKVASSFFIANSAPNSSVNFLGASGSFSIVNGTSSFENLNINAPNSTVFITGLVIGINGDLNILDGNLYPNTANYTMTIKGDYLNNATFTTSTVGTVAFTTTGCAGTNSITNGVFYNLTISCGTVTTFNPLIVTTITNVNGGTLVAATGSNWDLRGNVNINAAGNYNDGGQIHSFTGVTWSGPGGCVLNTGTILFNRNGAQNCAAAKFNNLDFTGSGVKILAGNVTINQDVYVRAAINYLNMSTFTITSNNALGVFTLEANATLYIRGANNCPTNFAAYDFNALSTTYYDANMNQIIGGISYGNLFLNTANIKTLGENTSVKGNLNFNNSTLDVSASNYTLFVSGDYNNNGGGSLICNAGEVIFDGTGVTQQNIWNGTTGTKTFYDVTVNKPAGLTAVFNNSDPVILNDLRVQSGILNINGNNVTVGGDLQASTGTFTTSGTFTMNNSTGTPSNIQSNGSVLNNIVINGPTSSFKLLDNFSIVGNFTLTAGTFDQNGYNAALGNGGETILILGTYKVTANGTMGVGNNATVNVNPSGIIEVVGSPTQIANVSNNTSGGRYNFSMSGTIKAQNYLFEYMTTSGIVINNGAFIDATNNFSNGTFTNGATNGVYLRVENNQTHLIQNTTFGLNPGGTAKNVMKTVNTVGVLTFNNYLGIFAGPTFESDPHSIINWTGPITLTWNGSVSTDWFTANNWTASAGPSIVPTGAEDVIIATATNQPIVILDGALTNKLTINTGATLTLNTPFASAPDFTINSDALINGLFVSSGAGDTIICYGNWSKPASGTFLPGNSTSIFAANTVGTISINNGASQFNNVLINGTANFQLGANSLANGYFNIAAGNLDVTSNNYTLTVKKNWTNSGTFNPRNGTVTLTAASAGLFVLNNGASSFFNLTINGVPASVYNVTTNDLRSNGNTNLLAGTLNLNNLTMYNGDNIGVDALNIAGTLDMGTSGTIKNGASSSLNVNNGGVLKMVGSSSSIIASVTRQTTGTYSFNVNSGGTIQPKFYSIQYTNANGLYIKNGGNIDVTNNLSNGSFSNGALGGTYINLENNFSDFTANLITFNPGATYNVTRIFGLGVITVNDAGGVLGSYLYENDDLSAATGNVLWTTTQPQYVWTGDAIDNNWFNVTNWIDNFNAIPATPPDATIIAVIPDVSGGSNSYPNINNGNANCFDLNIAVNATVTISANRNITIANSVTNSGTITVTNGSTSNITVANLWNNAGIFNNGASSTVTMTAPSGIKGITPGASPFYNLTFNTGATFQTLSSLDCDGSLTIIAGTLQVANPAHQIFVGGNWSNSGTFIHGDGLVTFDKTSGIQTITNAAGETFNNLKIANSGTILKTVQLNNTINVNANLDIFNVKCALDGGANTINLKGNWTNNGSVFTSTGTVNFIGTTNQTIKRVAAAGENFNNITLSNTADAKLLSNVTLAGNATLNVGTLDGSSRILAIGGNLAGAGNLSFTSGTCYLSGLYTNTGTFTKGTSSFFYQGTITQTVRAVDYYNLYSTSTGARILVGAGTIGVSGTFSPGTNVYTVTNSLVNFNGTASQVIPVFNFYHLTSSSSGSRNLSAGTVGVAGNFTPGANSYAAVGNTMNLNGTGAQAIAGAFPYFNNLTQTGIGSVVTMGGAISVSTNLIIASGTFNTAQFQITGSSVGQFTMAAGTTITIGSTTNAAAVTWPTNFTIPNTNIDCASTQIYQANGNQTIANLNPKLYGNLQINSGASATNKTFTGTLLVCGNLTSGTTSTLVVGANTITVGGNYTGTGALSFTSGTFNIAGNWTNSGTATIGTSTINYNGTASQTIGAFNYYNLTSSSTGARTLANSGTIGVANVFTPGTNVYTITGSTVDFNGSASQTIPVFNYNNLTSSSTGARILATTGNIGVAGNFVMGVGNAYTTLSSTVLFNGTGTQTASAFTFDNITVNKTGSVTPLGATNVEGTMTLTNGNYNTTGQNLTFVSTVSKTGRIAAITSGTITGNIIMQRTAPGGTTGWTWLGSCITNTTLADWYNNNTEIFMSGFPGVSYAGSFVSVYGYNEAAPGVFSSAASYVTPSDVTDAIPLGKGFWVYLGNGYTTTTNMTFDSRGLVHSGNFNFAPSYTNNGLPTEDGWNLMANPYPSAIDWDAPSFSRSNMSNTYYAWNADINNYVTYTTGVGGTNGGTKDIPSSQGFYIKASSAAATMTATENVKSVAQPTFVRSASSNTFAGNISIKATKAGSLLADEALFRFDDVNATDGLDDLDSYKLYPSQGGSINVSTKVGGDDFSINSLQTFDHSFNMPVKFVTNNNGYFTITIDGLNNITNNFASEFANDYLVLVDATGNETNLSNTNSISFAATTADSVKNFVIRFHNPIVTALPAIVKTVNNDVTFGNDVTGAFVNFNNIEATNATVNVMNTLGQVIETITLNSTKGKQYLNNKVNFAEGIYMIQVNYNGKQAVGKLKF